jgi:hypothetical protein
MIEETLQERGNNYGNFHTQANLTQTLTAIIDQHYNSVHRDEDGVINPLPHFMKESIHMICHKLARIANGNPYYEDSWHDIGGYSQLVVQILETQVPVHNNNLQTEGTEDA